MLFSIAILGLICAASAQATTTQSTTTATTTGATTTHALIASLLEQINVLQAKIRNLIIEQREVMLELVRNLDVGSMGDDVKSLQEFLASQDGVYPEGLITGYFGQLTRKAVKRFQELNGIDPVGQVGPITRNFIKSLGKKDGVKNQIKVKKTSRTVSQNTVATSSTTATSTESGLLTICHLPGGDPAKAQTITIGAPAWQAHQKHGDYLGTCVGQNPDDGDDDNVDTEAPTITDIVQNAASTTASVSWKTNEQATGNFYYSTANPLVLASSTALTLERGTEHSINLSGLSTSTEYFYIIEASDTTGNTATTSQHSLTTAAE